MSQIVGWTVDAALYCPSCVDKRPKWKMMPYPGMFPEFRDIDDNPIFTTDELEDPTCMRCGTRIDCMKV